ARVVSCVDAVPDRRVARRPLAEAEALPSKNLRLEHQRVGAHDGMPEAVDLEMPPLSWPKRHGGRASRTQESCRQGLRTRVDNERVVVDEKHAWRCDNADGVIDAAAVVLTRPQHVASDAGAGP